MAKDDKQVSSKRKSQNAADSSHIKKKALKRLNPMNAQLALANIQETPPSIILASDDEFEIDSGSDTMSNSNIVDKSLPNINQDSAPISATEKPNENVTTPHGDTSQIKTRTQMYAKQDNQTLLNTLPGDLSASTRRVHLISDSPRFTLTKINPIRIQQAIDNLTGEVEDVKYLSAGSLIITCKSFEQAKQFLDTNFLVLPDPDSVSIPIKASVAVNEQSVKGKIYAPSVAHCDMSLDEILQSTKKYGVIEVRRFFNDPAKANVPVFILTFFGTTLPEQIRLGYQSVHVDKYFPQPMICQNCFRMGHSAKLCHSKAKCRKCGSTSHTIGNCTSSSEKCANCEGPHKPNDRNCPLYKEEAEICKLRVDQNISFQEARKIVHQKKQQPQPTRQTSHPPTQRQTNSYSTNPPLTKRTAPGTSMNSLDEFPPLTTSHPTQPSPSDTSNSSDEDDDDSQWFTQQKSRKSQRKRQSRRQKNSTQDKEFNDLLEDYARQNVPLPPTSVKLNPHKQTPSQKSTVASSEPPSASRTSNTKQQGNLNIQSISEVLATLLPILLKIILADSPTSKIEAFMEMASIFSLEELAKSTLSSMDSVTPSSSTQKTA